MRYSKEEQKEAREFLLRVLKPGDTVFTVLRNVSRSGMSRNIDLYLLGQDEKLYLTYSVAALLGYSRAKDGSIKVSGCGMDMGFHVVYSLSRVLFLEYTCPGDKCKSGDHVNSRQDENANKLSPFPHDGKMLHHDGYAISQDWI